MSVEPAVHASSADPESREPGDPPGRSAWASLRPLVLRLHFHAGVFIAPLGIPLAVFLAVDIVLGEVAYRRGRRTRRDPDGSGVRARPALRVRP
ncbi:hypothetical protein ACFWXA_23095 [Streptomyces atroolivaceus]|uniref:hypothetical protein n=1 Tax=Streptomyces atroolivaceus TaxID=66869 RepID=UPI00366167AB